MPTDFYKILGVERNASSVEIKKQYRRLARKYHPDVSKLKNAEKRFKEVNEAYDVLKNKEKRSNYDNYGSADGNPFADGFRPPPGGGPQYQSSRSADAGDFGGFGQGNFSDIFDKMFNSGGQRQQSHDGFSSGPGGFSGAQKPAEQSIEVSVSLEDVFNGAEKTFRLSLPGQKEPKRLKVKIPKGIKQGQKIRLSKQGSNGADLFLVIKYKTHHLYTLEANDIFINLPITVWEAALGTTLTIPTLGGNVEMKIPAGSQSGKKLRLKGRGLGKVAGNQFVTLLIKLDPKPSKEIEEIYAKMKQISEYNPRENL
jgi:curved DNA-binding protein